MSTRGQFNTKSPTIKRILKEASELSSNPSPDLHAEPLEDNLFQWHFTIRGPPSPSSYAGGIYHGRIDLPPTYPLRPPAFRFLTPTGRFEVNREICLSISGHHEETWQPAWGIRTAMVAIRSFMDTSVEGQVGGIECGEKVRQKMAAESVNYTCPACGKSNEGIMEEREEMARLVEARDGKHEEEKVPEELRLGYRDELGMVGGPNKPVVKEPKGKERAVDVPSISSSSSTPTPAPTPAAPSKSPPAPAPVPRPTRTIQPAIQQLAQQTPDRGMAWIDAGIYGIVAALLFMVFRKLF